MRHISLGYNGPPRGFPDERIPDLDAGAKRMVMVHAEANALSNATFDRRGTILLVTRHPCAACAGLAVAAGVQRLVCPPPAGEHSKWHREHLMAKRLLGLADVSVVNRTEDGRFVCEGGVL
jgi:dCMP deaminase